eukprot:7230303-Alexandrium_andersonii.AAC.1
MATAHAREAMQGGPRRLGRPWHAALRPLPLRGAHRAKASTHGVKAGSGTLLVGCPAGAPEVPQAVLPTGLI